MTFKGRFTSNNFPPSANLFEEHYFGDKDNETVQLGAANGWKKSTFLSNGYINNINEDEENNIPLSHVKRVRESDQNAICWSSIKRLSILDTSQVCSQVVEAGDGLLSSSSSKNNYHRRRGRSGFDKSKDHMDENEFNIDGMNDRDVRHRYGGADDSDEEEITDAETIDTNRADSFRRKGKCAFDLSMNPLGPLGPVFSRRKADTLEDLILRKVHRGSMAQSSVALTISPKDLDVSLPTIGPHPATDVHHISSYLQLEELSTEDTDSLVDSAVNHSRHWKKNRSPAAYSLGQDHFSGNVSHSDWFEDAENVLDQQPGELDISDMNIDDTSSEASVDSISPSYCSRTP